jgi:RNA polymerase sigma factor (sigma-70 family)
VDAHAAGPAGFDDYVRARYAELRRLAFLLCGDWAAADDAVQTALIRCEKRWSAIRDPQRHAYVRRAVVNTTSTWRLRRRVHRPLSDLQDVASRDRDSDERLAVLEALRRLPPGQRQVVVLRYFECMSEAEIAATLGRQHGHREVPRVAGTRRAPRVRPARPSTGGHTVTGRDIAMLLAAAAAQAEQDARRSTRCTRSPEHGAVASSGAATPERWRSSCSSCCSSWYPPRRWEPTVRRHRCRHARRRRSGRAPESSHG